MADVDSQENELLALESIYEDQRIFIRSPNEKGGQLNIYLELPDDFLLKIRSAHVPPSLRNKTATHAVSEEGSSSGFESVKVKYLPPIVLNFEFPKDYPSNSPPNFTLSCKWLTIFKLSKLCKHLDKLWEEQGPREIIFDWDSKIKDEALNILRIYSPYSLHFTRKFRVADLKQVDKRAVQDVGTYTLMVKAVLDFNESEMERVFNSNYFQCDVCFDEKLGSVCMKFDECSHIFCCECLREYFTVQINDGSAKSLTCPTPKCESQAQPSQVKCLVSPDLFHKYDKFLLQTTLDSMTDIVYCPRTACQTTVLLEKESSVGVCPACKYAFCIFCKKASHGVSPCSIKDSEFRKLRDEYMAANGAEKSLMEKKYGKQRLKHILEEAVSDEWLKENAKKCPNCGCNIQKIEGCNHMTCKKCRNHFCWLCNALLPYRNPYSHFQNPGEGCFNRLFEGEDELNDDDEDDDDDWWF